MTLAISRPVKPCAMAPRGWIYIGHVFAPWLPAAQHDGHIAGLVLLAAAPCTATVFACSQRVRGEPRFTLSRVAGNDAIMVVAFAPVVGLPPGLSAIAAPWTTLVVPVAPAIGVCPSTWSGVHVEGLTPAAAVR